MKKIFISIFLISFIFNFANAEEVKQSKQIKDTNKNELDNNEDDSSKKLLELQERLKKTQKRTEDLKELRKTVDELNGTLGIKK